LFGSFLVVAVALTFSLGFVQKAHAQDYGGSTYDDYGGGYDYGGGSYNYSGGYDYGYNGGCCDYGSSYGGSTYDTPTSFSNYGGSTYDDYTYGGSTYDDYVYGGSTYDSGYTYTPDSYSSGSSFSLGGGYGGYGGYSYGGGYSYPSWGGYGGGGYTNVNTNTNTNYQYTYSNCVGTNNCNTVNTTVNNPSPTVTYTSPSYSYPTYSYPSYTTAYTNPIAITGTTNPYVSLSAIPYTGLELGFWGTIAYWGFLILWCLFVAYLIVVKRVQNKFVAFLFGEKEVQVAHTHVEPAQHAHVAPVVATASKADAIDSFIMTQIHNRSNA
jgi:hypothetical protein